MYLKYVSIMKQPDVVPWYFCVSNHWKWTLPSCMVTMAPMCLGAVQDHAHWHQPFARKPKNLSSNDTEILSLGYMVHYSPRISVHEFPIPLNFLVPSKHHCLVVILEKQLWSTFNVSREMRVLSCNMGGPNSSKLKGHWLCSACTYNPPIARYAFWYATAQNHRFQRCSC